MPNATFMQGLHQHSIPLLFASITNNHEPLVSKAANSRESSLSKVTTCTGTRYCVGF